ncbi:hypothetical protein LINGRAHAP2_LOCUS13521 [Linum grandiflorum]
MSQSPYLCNSWWIAIPLIWDVIEGICVQLFVILSATMASPLPLIIHTTVNIPVVVFLMTRLLNMTILMSTSTSPHTMNQRCSKLLPTSLLQSLFMLIITCLELFEVIV